MSKRNIPEYDKDATGNRKPKSKVKPKEQKFPTKHPKRYLEDHI